MIPFSWNEIRDLLHHTMLQGGSYPFGYLGSVLQPHLSKTLAQVAERADERDSPGNEQNKMQDSTPPEMVDSIHYKPVQDRMMSKEMVSHLFSSFVV